MASPKVMLSSTCFDLMKIRENLEAFIKNMGYDTIRSDKGDIAYNIKETLKEDCFLAAQQCDILVGIIGGNFGSEATEYDSISMAEMKSALEYKKQVYLFVYSQVLTETSTYNKNLNSKGEIFVKQEVEYSYVNDIRIFDFINSMYQHKSESVVIFDFKKSADISDILKKQWASLFQAFLSQKERDMQSSAYSKINRSADKLELLVNLFENNIENLKSSTNFMLNNIEYVKFIANPIIKHLKENILKTEITIIFKNLKEFIEIMHLFGYREYEEVDFIGGFICFTNKIDDYNSSTSYFYETIWCHKILFNDENLVFPNTDMSIDQLLFIVERNYDDKIIINEDIIDEGELLS